ncbi:MAG TPA: 2Fe-2S iron-sulfur cluster-binding protein [Streptomyces sp.]|nr:2Fe-2S iron-sulfur cluster-binding protein [Streptomyces sp.]
MSNEQQQPDQSAHSVPPPSPEGGWGEYDGDATAFIQLPGPLPGPYQSGPAGAAGGQDPLAAPGTGTSWTPPVIETRSQPPVTPAATTDPAAPGQWTMPFAEGLAEPAPEPHPGPQPEPPSPHSQQPGVPPSPGQGAAAALAGSHEARSQQHRPPDGGHGPGVPDGLEAPVPGATGQWSIPFAGAGSPDDSGEYLAAAVAGAEPEPPRTTEAAPQTAPPEGAAPETAAAEAAGIPDPTDGTSPEGAPSEGASPQPPEPNTPEASAPEASAIDAEHPHVSYVLHVNGADRPVTDAWVGESLLYVLRERLGLAGAKDGCAQGECGACSVQVDGRLVASCLVPAATTAGSEIRTVEGLAENGMPCDVQRALAACGAVQCGFCVPGMAMTLHDLLEGNHEPTELEARQAISGNLCRCSGYRGVLDAVRAVVAEREARAAAFTEAQEAEDTRNAGHPEDPGTEAGGEPRIRIPHQAGPHQAAPPTGGLPPQQHPHHDHHLPQDGGAQ